MFAHLHTDHFFCKYETLFYCLLPVGEFSSLWPRDSNASCILVMWPSNQWTAETRAEGRIRLRSVSSPPHNPMQRLKRISCNRTLWYPNPNPLLLLSKTKHAECRGFGCILSTWAPKNHYRDLWGWSTEVVLEEHLCEAVIGQTDAMLWMNANKHCFFNKKQYLQDADVQVWHFHISTNQKFTTPWNLEISLLLQNMFLWRWGSCLLLWTPVLKACPDIVLVP